MDNILFVNACISKDSRTLRLARHLLEHIEGHVMELDLQKEEMISLDSRQLEQREHGIYQTSYAKLLSSAEIIVIAAPFYDLSFPSLLKTFIEMCCVQGIAFYYDETGQCHSLCRAKKMFYVSTAGGSFDPRFGFDYIKEVFSMFFGVKDSTLFMAENLDLFDQDPEAILHQAEVEMDAYFE